MNKTLKNIEKSIKEVFNKNKLNKINKINKINKKHIFIFLVCIILIGLAIYFRRDIKETFTGKGPRFIIYKGYEGLGDRWQVLIQVIEYARITGRILVIDWFDHMWCGGNSRRGFDHYLRFTGDIPAMKYSDFKQHYLNNKNDLTITPSIWKKKGLFHNKYGGELYNKEYDIVGGDGQIQKICEGARDFREDVVVYCALKGRTHFFDRFKHVRLSGKGKEIVKNSRIVRELRPILENPRDKYVAIHMRGGDRVKDEFKNGSKDKDKYVKSLIEKLNSSLKNHNTKNIVVMSDSDYLVEEFNKQFLNNNNNQYNNLYNNPYNNPYNIFYSDVLKLPKKVNEMGIHKIPKDVLKENNISKNVILDNNFVDFYVLLMSDEIIGDGVSNFSGVSTNIKNSLDNKKDYSMGLFFAK